MVGAWLRHLTCAKDSPKSAGAGKTLQCFCPEATRNNYLAGNGLQDFRFLERNYSSVYSIPDMTNDRSPFFNLSARHNLNSGVTVSGNAYFRYLRNDTNNGDINAESFDESLYNLSAADIAALKAAGYSGFPTTGNATTEPFPVLALHRAGPRNG